MHVCVSHVLYACFVYVCVQRQQLMVGLIRQDKSTSVTNLIKCETMRSTAASLLALVVPMR